MPYVHTIVEGRVQGVGFRFFAREAARRLGLKGSVRNLPDGSVEVEAIGDRAALQKLVGQLQRGPGMAYVTDVRTEWSDNEPVFTDFRVAF